MAITRHFVEAVIRDLKWQPYIVSHWLNFTTQKGGAIITFKNHTDHEFKCSHKIAQEILTLQNK